MPDWVRHAIWWHVYPLGFVGAFPGGNHPPRASEHRLGRIVEWFDHAIRLGASGIALGPVFASRTHGYDTTDPFRIDPRLGDEEDFDLLVAEARSRGLRVLLDGVFNHVGTDFAQYRRALEDGDPVAAAWFRGHPGRFHTFEGHGDLITLDHRNPAVAEHTVAVMRHWLDRGADGWRLDAAYAVPATFWREVLPRVRQTHPEAWFVAEVIHGDYREFINDSGADSLTQYELWKAVWSSLNDGNFHELDWALQRHNRFLESFVPQTFIGNHDVTRVASRLHRAEHVALAMVILFTTGGVPTVYAGDEFGYEAVKEDRAGGDDAVRPEFGAPPRESDPGPQILDLYRFLIGLRRRHPWLHEARTSAVRLDKRCYAYETRCGDDALLVALNTEETPVVLTVHSRGRPAQVLAGTGAPPQQTLGGSGESAGVCQVVVAPHGWLILSI